MSVPKNVECVIVLCSRPGITPAIVKHRNGSRKKSYEANALGATPQVRSALLASNVSPATEPAPTTGRPKSCWTVPNLAMRGSLCQPHPLARTATEADFRITPPVSPCQTKMNGPESSTNDDSGTFSAFSALRLTDHSTNASRGKPRCRPAPGAYLS